MIKHVVMWKLRGPSGEERRAQAQEVRSALQALAGNIPGLLSLEVGLGPASEDPQQPDVVLISTHENWDALADYQSHPAHSIAAGVIGALRIERRVLDFEVTSAHQAKPT